MSRIIVKNLPKVVSEQKLHSLFEQKGTITDIQLKYKDGKFRQFAFIGFLEEKSGEKAKDFFNNSFVGTNKINVELCTALGDDSKPQSWSKYARDSETSKKKEKNIITDPVVNKPKSTNDKIDEMLSNYKNDPQFQEFMRAHANKDKLEWENDFGISSKNVDGLVTPEKDTSLKLANLEISDIDYKKQLMMMEESNVTETESNKNPLQLFTVKIRNIPKKMKRDDLKKFFRPSKAHSVRIPKNQAFACAYVGFKLERDMKRALLKDKSFLKGKQVHVYEFNSKRQEEWNEDGSSKKNHLNSRWQEQEEKLKGEENICDTGKLFFRNLSYTVSEDDIQEVFEKYGSIVELNVPIDATTRKMKGFGTVSFLMPQDAYTAYTELNGTMFQGRMFHILPGKSCDKATLKDEPKNFKDMKLKDMKRTASSAANTWNTLFINANAVSDVIAKSFGKSKEDVLESSSGGAAVRLALGESQIVLEMKSFLESHGVRLEAFEGDPKKRSKTVILVKNIPSGTDVGELQAKFATFGIIERIILPPSGVTCLVKFSDPSEARIAFKKLAYTKFKHVPLFLEWAPKNTFRNDEDHSEPINKSLVTEGQKEKEAEEEEDIQSTPEPNSTLFIKNLNFQTTENSLHKIFNTVGVIHSIQIAKKKDGDGKFIHLGYGFIQYKLLSAADKALKMLQHKEIDGHKIELKRSDRTINLPTALLRKSVNKADEQRNSTKIMVRNIPFQANMAEVRLLFQTFGEIRAIRLPKKNLPGAEQQHRGFGFVDFVNKSDARNAFNALRYSTHLYGRRLVLEWASNEEDVSEIRKRTAQHSSNAEEDVLKKPRKGWLKDELFMKSSNFENEEIN